LPYRPAMVPVLHGLLSWLSRPRLVSPTLLPGQVWSPPLASGAGDLKIGMPDGSELEAAGFMEPGRLPEEASLRFDRTRQPGVYRLIGPAAAVARTPSALQAVAVNVDPAESDQAFWSPARIRSLFPQGRCEVVPPDGQADAVLLTESSGREIWPGLAVLLAAGLLAEALLAYRFSFQKKARVMPAQPSASFRTWGSPA